jgi:hypothetical protein
MQKTILTIIFALLLALTGWAQKFTISGDLSVMTNKFGIAAWDKPEDTKKAMAPSSHEDCEAHKSNKSFQKLE